MEMYVYDDNDNLSRRITFELPVEWYGDSSTFHIDKDGDKDRDDIFKLSVWMVNVKNATREDVLEEYNLIAMTGNYGEPLEILNENIYSTENYEVFYYKSKGTEAATNIYFYYLYANGERFCLFGYVFDKDKPEYDEIFKRIAESVRF